MREDQEEREPGQHLLPIVKLQHHETDLPQRAWGVRGGSFARRRSSSSTQKSSFGWTGLPSREDSMAAQPMATVRAPETPSLSISLSLRIAFAST